MAQTVVIIGGGVIGASTAYHLAKAGARPVVVEAVAPAASASGRAGGFLAAAWCDGAPWGPLARRSFALHAQLAAEHGGEARWGYRRTSTFSLKVDDGGRDAGAAAAPGARRRPKGLPAWVDGAAFVSASVLGGPEDTAQVHPKLLTDALLAESGAEVRLAEARRLVAADGGGRAAGVVVAPRGGGEEEVLAADAVVVAAGAWTGALLERLAPAAPALPVSGLKVHSVVLGDARGAVASADMMFLAYRGPGGKSLEPEIYPRPDGTVYVCGVADEGAPLPACAADVAPAPGAAAALRRAAGAAATALADAERAPLLAEQACFLPTVEGDGMPAIGRVEGWENVYVAAGHSCWGILLAPATGEALAALVAGERPVVDLGAFEPNRFL